MNNITEQFEIISLIWFTIGFVGYLILTIIHFGREYNQWNIKMNIAFAIFCTFVGLIALIFSISEVFNHRKVKKFFVTKKLQKRF